jgi:L-ascorbate metabolism protein UlaG (beta-lactamase superfamily)
MQLTKYGHACIGVEKDGRRLIIDPGAFSSEPDLAEFDAVLVTHEHPDHFVEAKVRAAVAANPELRVWTNASVAGLLDGIGQRVEAIGEGDEFAAAGFDVRVYGQLHAVIHSDIPRIANVGFLLDGRLFHPGDALTVPAQRVETLMLPVHAPWSRISDLIDWVREVAPVRSFAVHDGALNAIGLGMVGGLLGEKGPGIGTEYRRLEPPELVELP